jgi:hypothetical protein
MKHSIKLIGLFTLVALLCGGCATSKVQPSGFLGDNRVYNAMKPDPELEGVMIYKEQPFPLAGFDSFIVPPVSVYLSAEGIERGVSDEDLREIANNFRKNVIKVLGARYQMVAAAAPRVAILKMAITDADPNLALMNVHPGSLILGGGMGGASMEVDLIDSMTGQRVAAVMASSKGKRYNYGAGLSKWGHTNAVLEDWAKVLAERIEKSHG